MLLERKRDLAGRTKNDPAAMNTPPLSPLRKSSLTKSSKPSKDEEGSQRRPSRGFFSRSSKSRKQSNSSPVTSQIEREGSISTDGGGELLLSPTASLLSSTGNSSSGDLHFNNEESGSSISERITPGPRSSSRGGTSVSSGISDQIHNLSIDDRSRQPPISATVHQLPPEPKRASLTRQYADWEISPTIVEDVLVEGLEKTKRDLGESVAEHNSSRDSRDHSSIYSEPNTLHQMDDTMSNKSTETTPSSTTSDDHAHQATLSSPSTSPKSKHKEPQRHSRVRGNVTDFKASLSPNASGFAKTLMRLEASGVRAMFQKLTERGDDATDEEPLDVAFERRLWAMVASQWLMFGKQIQCPGHDILVEAKVEDGRRILHLHGQLADGWVLAAKYPRTTVYSVSSKRIKPPSTSSGWTAPLNHHPLYTPSVKSPIPFPNHYFDCVVSRGLSSVCKVEDLDVVLGECLRVLKPGGWLEVQTIDPQLSKGGDITRRWIESRVLIPMENSSFSTKPAEKILQSVNKQGLSEVRNARIALPVWPLSADQEGSNPAGMGDGEAQRMMAALGKHFYEENYKEFIKSGHVGEGKPEWWWNSRAVKKECEREKDTCFALTITFGRKL